jgi:hypothetical protein
MDGAAVRIADQIALVTREFISGDELFRAVKRQEGVSTIQAASWFLRHIKDLDTLPMVAVNQAKQDFRQIDAPWASDIYEELAAGVAEVTWDERGDGYVGGWLKSHLQKFFSQAGIPLPDFSAIDHEKPSQNEDASEQQIGEATSRASSITHFLTENSSDFTELKRWLESFGTDLMRTGMALRLATEKIGGFVPLYLWERADNANFPQRLSEQATSALWAELIIELPYEMWPDFLNDHDGVEIWLTQLFVRDVDCSAFLSEAGLSPSDRKDIGGGTLVRGTLDFDRAIQSTHIAAPTLSLPGSPPKKPEKERAGDTEKGPSGRERENLLRAIGALLGYIAGELPGVEKHPNFVGDTELIRLLDKHFDGFEGLSASNLSRKFPIAKRLLRN